MSTANERLIELVDENLKGVSVGLTSVCSSHPLIVEAAISQSKENDTLLLIESTSNQVDQFGGYSGMKPDDFRHYIEQKLQNAGVDLHNVILGGDHLGPNRWRTMEAEKAMNLAHEQIASYVQAGYKKIHLDASMTLGDDRYRGIHSVSEKIVAERTALLCKTSEKAYALSGQAKNDKPVYVIGTEVPIPGGETDSSNSMITATKPDHVAQTIELTRNAFYELGLREAWERVIGLVVQPKIDFGNEWICLPDPAPVRNLKEELEKLGNRICFEAHSTDYQDEETLRMLVNHHFAFLKVGPALSFALRESLYALEHIERDLFHNARGIVLSELQNTMEHIMNNDPKHWQNYCSNSSVQFALKHYGLSDRTRYYLGEKSVVSSMSTLFNNLRGKQIPIGLVHQFLPRQSSLIENGLLDFQQPEEITRNAVRHVLDVYHRASKRVVLQHKNLKEDLS